MSLIKKFFSIFIIVFFLIAFSAYAGGPEAPPKPGPKDTCPVCGMFVSLYPEWIASVRLSDGSARFFDGAKDLFKYLNDMETWAQGMKREDVTAVWVTEYYTLQQIDAEKAFYIIGSDVLGPMGHELIPCRTVEDAEEFLKDHKGMRILRFSDVTPQITNGLDNGRFQ